MNCPAPAPGPLLTLPRALTRAARGVLAWAILLANEDGIVAHADLVDVLDVADRSTFAKRLRELEGHGLIIRLRRPNPVGSFIRIAWARLYGRTWNACINCPRPAKNVRGARYCAVCQASLARHDRSWKAMAFEIWADGTSKRQGESTIVYRVRAATGHPLFTPSETGSHEGIVPWMVSEKLLVDALWRERMRAATTGEGDDVP